MKQLKYTLLVCILSLLNLSETRAQGLSLSFDLIETDTLANMIADSKKYDIESLTLSGYVNDANTKYIQDLNQNGKLISLDLSNIVHISAKGQKRVVIQKFFGSNTNNNPRTRFEGLAEFLNKYGYPATESINQNDLRYLFSELTVTITDIIDEESVTRTFSGMSGRGLGRLINYNKTIQNNYCILMPKRIFDLCSFSKFVAPKRLEILGGDDCSYRVKKCDEYIVGDKVSIIAENAFKDSYIGELSLSSNVTEIKTSAFENTSGNISSDIFSNVAVIGDNAFKNCTCLNGGGENLKLKVSTIGQSAFQNAKFDYDITLYDIKELGDSAFMSSSINNIEIGAKLESIGDNTFANCLDLHTFVGGYNIFSIGEKAFYGCIKLNSFNSSNTLYTIGKEAFANDYELTSFSIPNEIKSIGYGAFTNSGLKELQIGKNIEYRRDITTGCDSLEYYTVDSNNEKYNSIDGVLFSKNGTILIAYPYGKKDPIYEIRNDVIEIADSAFYSVNKLNALTIAESVKKIGKNTFANSNIWEVKVLPATAPKVSDNNSGLDQSLVRLFVREKDYNTYYITNYWGDFKNIYVLEKAVSADGIINIEKAGTISEYIGFSNQFKYNTLRLSGHLNSDDIRYLREMAGRDIRGNKTSGVLSDLDFSQATIIKGGDGYLVNNLSSKLTTSNNIVGERMFEGCNFTNLIISESVTKIGDKALSDCPLVTFRVPTATQELNLNSFFGMTTLKGVVVDEANNSYLSKDGVLFTKDGKTLLLYPNGKEGDSYTTPASVVYIGDNAFGGYKLKKVTLNEGVKEIGDYAFDLEFLESVGLPSTLELLGHRAFFSCNQLMDIMCLAITPPTIRYDPYAYFGQPYNNFSDKTYNNASLMVPEGSSLYKTRKGWSLFKNILEMDLSDVESVQDNISPVDKIYDISGRENKNLRSGLNIIRGKSGVYKKVMMK